MPNPKFFRDFFTKNMKLEFEYLTQIFKDGICYYGSADKKLYKFYLSK
jgi:hypothetical protein